MGFSILTQSTLANQRARVFAGIGAVRSATQKAGAQAAIHEMTPILNRATPPEESAGESTGPVPEPAR